MQQLLFADIMESGNNNNIKTTNTTTILLALVLSVASFAGTIISMPQMIGSANAQSTQGSSQACPAGFTLQQGKCTHPAVCPPAAGFSASATNGICTYTCVDTAFCGSITGTRPATCPTGAQLVGNECVIRPGNRG
jgi:hypothetical protein